MSEEVRCLSCGHQPHQRECWNMASDNECSCPGTIPAEANRGPTPERPTLADVIAAHRRFGMQCTCGWCGEDLLHTFAYQHDRHVADAAREHILRLLADETLVEAVTQRLFSAIAHDDWEQLSPRVRTAWRGDAQTVLAVVAEHLGAS